MNPSATPGVATDPGATGSPVAGPGKQPWETVAIDIDDLVRGDSSRDVSLGRSFL
jgi:hypothetical protein